jgi:hypothetical protein
MKKYIFLLITLGTLSVTVYAQDSLQVKAFQQSDCGLMEGFIMGAYNENYKGLNDNDFDTIINRLNILLNCKDIQMCRKSDFRFDAWFTLMRIGDIKWTTHRQDILIFLKKFLTEMLSENSFLNKENRNILLTDKGCPFSLSDPTTFPQACYWVVMKLDRESGVKLIEDTWGKIVQDEPFASQLRMDIVHTLSPYYKNNDVQLLLERIEKTNMPDKYRQRIQQMRYKYELLQSKNQLLAWKTITQRGLFETSGYFWIDNISVLKETFTNIDIKIPLDLAVQEKDIKTKYWLTYSACFLINSKYPTKAEASLVKQIDKLVESLKNEKFNFKTGDANEDDYLNDAYQALKTWH